MTWLYQNQPVEELPEDCVGFVYLITNITTDRKYIGKKLAKFSKITQRTVKLKNGTKKKKKIRSKIDSDWREYYGSSPELTKPRLKCKWKKLSIQLHRLHLFQNLQIVSQMQIIQLQWLADIFITTPISTENKWIVRIVIHQINPAIFQALF